MKCERKGAKATAKEKSFGVYQSVYDASKMLTDDEFVKAFRAVFTYHFEPEKFVRPIGGDLFNMFMTMTLPLSDSQKKNKGGAPEGNQNAKKKTG